MTRRERITRRLEAEAAKAAPQGYGGWTNAGPAFTDAFRSRRSPAPAELVEAYKSIAYACAQINAGAVVRTPLRLYQTTSAGQASSKGYRVAPSTPASRERLRRLAVRPAVQKYLAQAERVEEIADHPLLRAIVRPNPDFDQTGLIEISCLYHDIVGSAFWVPDAYRMGCPTEFWPIHSQYVNPIRDAPSIRVRAWQYYGEMYEAEELVHIKAPSVKDPYGKGYGPLQAAFEHARLHDSYTSVQDSLLGQGAKMTLVISPKDPTQPMGEPERARFEADANRRFSGGNAGRVFVTDGSIDVNPVSWPPSDLAAMQISDDALERFANCFGVPLALLQTESVNLANLEASRQQHAALAVEPRCLRIASGLTRWMHNAGRRLRQSEDKDRGWDRLFFAFDDPIGEDMERKSRVYDLQAKSGLRAINEIRADLGEPPVAWGDEPWLPTALSQPSGDQRKPQPAPAPALPKPDAPEVPEDDQEEPEAEDGEDAAKAYRPEREDGADPFRATKSPPRIRDGDAADDEGGEDNTYDLPDGAPLRRALRRWYERQLVAVLGKLPANFEDIPLGPGFFSLSSYDREMGEAMTPLLSLYWDEAGKALRESIGLDPDEWQVTDPNLAEAIERQTFAFCESTNSSTSDTLQRAHEKLREQLRQGVIEEGEALDKLTDRIKSVYETLDDSHAELIAITETNRAVHLASLRSAKESGVVAGKRPLISQNACPLCHRIVDEVNEKGSIGLDEDFAVVGTNPLYSHMKVPPFHPRCLLPGTRITAPNALGAVVANYSGPVVELTFDEGSRFTVTPNHMLLTPTGFAFAADLMEGDHVIYAPLGVGEAGHVPDDDHGPTLVEEVVRTLAVAGGVPPRRVPVAPEYLHGDAAHVDGDIHVVGADGLLRRHLDSACPKCRRNLALPVADVAGHGLPRPGDLASVLLGLRDATDGGVGSIREASAVLWAGVRHAGEHALASVAGRDACTIEAKADAASRDAEGTAQGKLGLPGEVSRDDLGRIDVHAAEAASPVSVGVSGGLLGTLDRLGESLSTCKIVSRAVHNYSGPVYDVETASSLYVIEGGIASSNCRCTFTTVLTPEYEALILPDSPYWANAGKAVPPGIESRVTRRLRDEPSVMATAMGD